VPLLLVSQTTIYTHPRMRKMINGTSLLVQGVTNHDGLIIVSKEGNNNDLIIDHPSCDDIITLYLTTISSAKCEERAMHNTIWTLEYTVPYKDKAKFSPNLD
jgi:hypothetical protein